MARIDITRKHNKTREQIHVELDNLSKMPECAEYLEYSWNSEKTILNMKGKGTVAKATGVMLLSPGEIRIVLDLPGIILGAFKNKVETILTRELDARLA